MTVYEKGKILTKNEKMKETEKNNPNSVFFNFNLPAVKTCPKAGKCKEFCYANQGRYIFPSVQASMERHLELTKDPKFIDYMDQEIKWRAMNAFKKGKQLYVRIHDSGDFYNLEYAMKWIEVANMNPGVVFYAYTKCVSMWHSLCDADMVPSNFHLVMSEGGKEDALIRPTDVRAIVINDLSEMKDGMMDATGNDMIAMKSQIVALPYHGSKKVKV